MSKPDLRAGLEADLKLVCEGRKTKEEVISFFQRFSGCSQLTLGLDGKASHNFCLFSGARSSSVQVQGGVSGDYRICCQV